MVGLQHQRSPKPSEANVMTTQVTTYLMDEANFMTTQVQENSHILFNAHKLHQRGFGPCAIFELQFQPHPKPLGCVTLLFRKGQEAS